MKIRVVYVIVAALVLAYAAFSVYQIIKEAYDLEKERSMLKVWKRYFVYIPDVLERAKIYYRKWK
jgi:hypothetical protein